MPALLHFHQFVLLVDWKQYGGFSPLDNLVYQKINISKITRNFSAFTELFQILFIIVRSFSMQIRNRLNTLTSRSTGVPNKVATVWTCIHTHTSICTYYTYAHSYMCTTVLMNMFSYIPTYKLTHIYLHLEFYYFSCSNDTFLGRSSDRNTFSLT